LSDFKTPALNEKTCLTAGFFLLQKRLFNAIACRVGDVDGAVGKGDKIRRNHAEKIAPCKHFVAVHAFAEFDRERRRLGDKFFTAATFH